MRPLVPVIGVSVVLAVAVWAYQQNYATKAALKRVDELNAEIAVNRDRLAILRAEWAYLNRPERLHDLAEMNFDRLGLMPMNQQSYGTLSGLPYPEVISAALPDTTLQVSQ